MVDQKSRCSVLTGLGSSAHTDQIRSKNDFYVTDPSAIVLLDKQGLLDKNDSYWECACGNGSLSSKLIELGYNVSRSSDLYDYGYGESGVDFLKQLKKFKGSIITNPPFNSINEFMLHGLELASNKVYIFGRIQTIESYVRYDKIFRDNPPLWVCPFVRRIPCYPNSETPSHKSAICYAWFIWDNKDHTNETKLKWLI